jgi:hypothetical protein
MKRNIVALQVVGIAFVFATCPWVGAQSASNQPDAKDIAANVQPRMPESATEIPTVPLAEPDGSGASVSEARGIQEAIDKFKFLFETRNADRLKKDIWPSMSPKQYHAIKGAFKVVSQVTVGEDCFGSPKITSDSAEWTCNETLGYYVTGKASPSQTHPIQFRLKKNDGKWYVDGRTGKVKNH